MRTTIDLPDALYREAKATAASRGLKLKDFFTAALRAALHPTSTPTQAGMSPEEIHRQRMAEHFLRMDEARTQQEPVGPLDRDSLHERHA
ncbi:MAG: hypothetical protein O3A87_09255 [Verrucomicrobia bacterium]|nr:hypothetical protein [Verrucomicrobiota bacterium]MDA1006646.1 hypothetical protein [Verrucomicrobiota bacterium]